MILLIDAGNTRIKWALVTKDRWTRSGILPIAQAGELSGLFSDAQDLREVWVSNVAGEEVAQHIRAIGVQPPRQIHFAVAKEMQCGVRNSYASPAQLGSDRWAALIAAWNLVKQGCLVVNCGTAITIDALSADGEFLGGLILPGIELMQRSLTGATARLKTAHAESAQGKFTRFPRNTADAMCSGAIQAACGAVDRQHALLEDKNAQVILGGGALDALRPHLNLPLRIMDNLVLDGLLLISKETAK